MTGPTFGALPAEIPASMRIVVWNREIRNGKPTKVPYIPHRPADKASVNDPTTWGAFPDAIAAVEDGKADGAGFVLGDGVIGIDLDHCRDTTTGAITPEAQAIIAALNSYTEISPSGTGVHILVRGTLPPGRKRKGWIEMYSEGRYFTLTGQHLAGTPTTIEDRTSELAALHARVFPPAPAAPPRPAHAATPALDLDDNALLDRAQHASNGAKFSALWNGDTGAYGSRSEADQALCNLLAFWTRADAGRMDRLFRQSGLFRPKWDERRGTSTYGDRTIEKAIAGCHDTYAGPRPAAHLAPPASDPTPGPDTAVEASAPSFPPSWKFLDDVQLLTLPDPEWIIDRVIQRRGVGTLYSPPGIGKTTFIAGMLVAIATGKAWFGHKVSRRGPCLYVAAEDPSGFKVRLRAAKRAALLPLDASIGVHTFPEAIDLRDPASVRLFRDFVQGSPWAQKPETIVIDTYAASMPGAAENSSEDVTTAMVHAQKLRTDLDVTVILVHHTNAAGSRERGHSAMRGAADFMLALVPSDDIVSVEASKQRNGQSGKSLFKLKLVPTPEGDGCVFRLAADVIATDAMTPAQAKIYAVLRDSFGANGATKSEWARCCSDVPERTFYHASTKLEERGYIKVTGSHFRVVEVAQSLPRARLQ